MLLESPRDRKAEAAQRWGPRGGGGEAGRQRLMRGGGTLPLRPVSDSAYSFIFALASSQKGVASLQSLRIIS